MDRLTIKDTLVIKGLALVLLLCHHLFYSNDGLYDDFHLIGDYYLVNEIGNFSKLCVVIFVFLSGYGLMSQSKLNGGIGNLKQWYYHRFKKLMLNYWLIWLVFVPISYLFFNRTFWVAYQTHSIWRIIADIFGLHEFFYSPLLSYNPTWWFYSCIIVLYILFPLFYRLIQNDSLSLVLLSVVFYFFPFPYINFVKFYMFAFVVGMWMASNKYPPPPSCPKYLLYILLLLFCIVRNVNVYQGFIDVIITLLLVQIYRVEKLFDWQVKLLFFCGKHSMNIFLFHTFIYYFWFREVIYASRNPIIIFLTLFAICIPISILLEWIKKFTIYKI